MTHQELTVPKHVYEDMSRTEGLLSGLSRQLFLRSMELGDLSLCLWICHYTYAGIRYSEFALGLDKPQDIPEEILSHGPWVFVQEIKGEITKASEPSMIQCWISQIEMIRRTL